MRAPGFVCFSSSYCYLRLHIHRIRFSFNAQGFRSSFYSILQFCFPLSSCHIFNLGTDHKFHRLCHWLPSSCCAWNIVMPTTSSPNTSNTSWTNRWCWVSMSRVRYVSFTTLFPCDFSCSSFLFSALSDFSLIHLRCTTFYFWLFEFTLWIVRFSASCCSPFGFDSCFVALSFPLVQLLPILCSSSSTPWWCVHYLPISNASAPIVSLFVPRYYIYLIIILHHLGSIHPSSMLNINWFSPLLVVRGIPRFCINNLQIYPDPRHSSLCRLSWGLSNLSLGLSPTPSAYNQDWINVYTRI